MQITSNKTKASSMTLFRLKHYIIIGLANKKLLKSKYKQQIGLADNLNSDDIGSKILVILINKSNHLKLYIYFLRPEKIGA